MKRKGNLQSYDQELFSVKEKMAILLDYIGLSKGINLLIQDVRILSKRVST